MQINNDIWKIRDAFHDSDIGGSFSLFHRRTRASYVYNGCLAWKNVMLSPRIHSSVKYSQLGQTDICDVCDHAHVPKLTVFYTLDWYVELTNTSYHTRRPFYTYKFVNTHLYHSRQLYNIHIVQLFRQRANDGAVHAICCSGQ